MVYMAEQQTPIRRRVALKIIKIGMDTRQVIARFEAERQTLALMDHANIARVFDAGATEAGRPYFVMELVRGIPITEYCDQNNLPVHERLELFVQVCQAVQHAHQKGIIHRDLKPSNVLVTLNDGRPVPKVIDFGVAKATNQQLTEKTLFTAFAQMVGTPLYMSPEQAEMSSLDVDTRSDIYSLGVLLYELLTGTTPFNQERLREVAYAEMVRIIREEEPPKPSTRISTLGEAHTATAAHRQIDGHRLGQLMKGDLDWIVMKSLEKDRSRRFQTATDLARDIQRYLTDQPVSACPPSAMYRLRKFARRNKAMVAMLGLAAAMLLSVVAVLAISNARTRRESAARYVALKEKDAALATVREAVDQMLVRVGDETLADLPLSNPLRQALLKDALKFYEGFVAQAGDDPSVRFELVRVLQKMAIVQRNLGQFNDACQSATRSIVLLEPLVAAAPDMAEYERVLAQNNHIMASLSLLDSRRYEKAEPYLRRALELFNDLERRHPGSVEKVGGAMGNLADRLAARGKSDEAYQLRQEARRRTKAYLAQNPDSSNATIELCWLDIALANQAASQNEKETLYNESIDQAKDQLKRHPGRVAAIGVLAGAETKLGFIYMEAGHPEQGVPHLQEALQRQMSLCFETAQKNCWLVIREIIQRLATDFRKGGSADELRVLLDRYQDWYEAALRITANETAKRKELWLCQTQLAKLYEQQGNKDKAEVVFRTFLERMSELRSARGENSFNASDFAELALEYMESKQWATASDDFRQAEKLGLDWTTLPWQWLIQNLPPAGDSPANNERSGGKLRDYLTEQIDRLVMSGDECNAIAWDLVASGELDRNSATLALKFAEKAYRAHPSDVNIWNTLGVSQYRAGNWQDAIKTLNKSIELRHGGDSNDWFFLAMAHWQLHDKEDAHRWNDKAIDWMDKNQPKNEELLRFRREAKELLNGKSAVDAKTAKPDR